MPAEAAACGPPEPEFRRRREIGAASARSLLLTALGEFALPAGRPVWTAAFLRALALVGVAEKAVRQALARSATEGWLDSERHGRRTAWKLTPAGRRLLTEGAERIYGFGAPVTAWDGRWLLVLAGPAEGDRGPRHLLRTRLAWSGLGSLSPGVWVSPHPEREPEVRDVLRQAGVGGTTTVFVGRLGEMNGEMNGEVNGAVTEARRVAAQAWDLAGLERAYGTFLGQVGRLRPEGDAATFGAQLRLVQEWRRFPFLDPGLPPDLLPEEWSGARAATLFRDRHRAWMPAANRFWQAIAE